MRWLMRLIRRDRLDRELDRELRFHVDEEAARLVAEGAPEADARRRALASFGGVEPVKEHTRDARGTRWLEDLLKDVRYAARMMRRHKGFTIAAVLSLALGIGANAAIFAIADALVWRPLPVARPTELVFLNRAGFDEPNLRFSHPLFLRLQAAAPGAGVAALSARGSAQVVADGAAELLVGQLVTGNYFDVAGVRPSAGRLLTPADATSLGGAPVAVLSHQTWMERFGSNPAVVGRSLRVNGMVLTVVGVAAPAFSGLTVGERVDLWLPVTLQHDLRWISNASMEDADGAKPWIPQDGVSWLTVVVRMPPTVDAVKTGAALSAILDQSRDRFLETVDDPTRREYLRRERLEVVPGARGLSSLRENFAAPLSVLMATAAMVLLIGCANLASLLLARGAARSREFALRLSLGARRGRLIRQMLTESVALAGLGGAAGLGVALWGSGALLRLVSPSGRLPLDVSLDWRLVAFTALVSVVTGIAFGLAPALRLSRADLAEAMKPGGRVTGAADRLGPLPFGRVLVVGQVALSLTLLVGAVLFLRTFANLIHVDTGFDRTRVIAARFDPRLSQIPAEQVPALYDRLLEAARRLPGSEAASLAMSGAVTGSQRISGLIVAGQPRLPEPQNNAREDFVGPDYFRLMGIPVVRGRDFGPQDAPGAPDAVVINETMARAFFGEADPIGKRIGYDEPAEMQIVGVVRDSLTDGLRRPPPKLVYHVLRQHPEEVARNLYVRVSGSADTVKPLLAQAVSRAEPALAVREVVTLDELTERTIANERLVSRLTGAFGVLAVLVACLGLYGTISYSVARRTGEIGVRIALGATPGRMMRQVLGETAWLVGAGTAAGLLLAFGLMGYTATLLYGLSPRDPMTLAGSALVLMLIGLLAGLVPARRASRVDPLKALRLE